MNLPLYHGGRLVSVQVQRSRESNINISGGAVCGLKPWHWKLHPRTVYRGA
jgi:hypothetical protein